MASPPGLRLAPSPGAHDDLDLLVPEPAGASRVLEVAAERLRAGVSGAMATILERHGSTPSTPGQKLWVGRDGSCVGTAGGGAVERELLTALRKLAHAEDPAHALRTFKLGPELGMCCGGQVLALLEPMVALVPCLVVGGGHVATALAPLLARVGFAVTVADTREAWGQPGRIPGVTSVVGEHDDVGATFPAGSALLVMTHDHGLDQQVIEWGLRRGLAFVGGVGSRAKAQRTRDRLLAKGFPEADVARVRMPLGVPIGARLPDEVATSIAAELIGWRNQRA